MGMYVTKNVFGIPIAACTLTEISSVILSHIKVKGKKTFFYVNAHCLNIANRDEEYKKILQTATFVYSGGFGPVLASKIFKNPLPERTPTPDFIDKIFAKAEKANWTIYLLGGRKGIAQKTAEKLTIKFPKLQIAGYHHGFSLRNKDIIKAINRVNPDIVLVGMGSPRQEKWIAENENKVNAKVFWAVGALFDVISEEFPRAPLWMQKSALEWFYRFLQEPKRLWKRYLLGNGQFLFAVFYRACRTFVLITLIKSKRLLAKIKIQLALFRPHANRVMLLSLAQALKEMRNSSLSPNEKKYIANIEKLRNTLEASRESIEIIDYGKRSQKSFVTQAQMYKGQKITKTIGEICRTASKTYIQALLLFQIIRHAKPSVCLELGTCLGISALYQGAALELNRKGFLTTIEGAGALAKAAQKNVKRAEIKRVAVITGRFQDVLPKILPKIAPIDFVFIDGHHDEKATVIYFKSILPYLSNEAILVFDDIGWSSGMKHAWGEIKSNEKVNFSFDLFNIGICIMKR